MRAQSPDVITIFESDTRGVSEAIAQGIIFMIVIATASGVAISGQDLIENTQDEASFEQALIGFESLDDAARSFTTTADENVLFTSKRQATLYARNAELEQVPQETTITINDTDTNNEYTISSQPLRTVHDQYTLVYDAGLIQSERSETTDVLRTPTDQYPATDRTLHLRTIWTHSTAQFHGGNRQFVLISERDSEPATVVDVSDGTKIHITTHPEYETMWVEYLETQGYLSEISTPESSAGRITAEFDGPATVYHQQLHVEPRDRFRE